MNPTDDHVIAATVRWLERAVIGLSLCPFAKGVHARGQIHYAVSHADDPAALLQDLRQQLNDLLALDASRRDTTLLIAPRLFPDFLEFHAFLAQTARLRKSMRLVGVVQIASFHPRFQFAGTDADAIGNFTNRAPYPTLHLLRESSVDLAVRSFPEADLIFGKNLQTLEQLGSAGWESLGLDAPDKPL